MSTGPLVKHQASYEAPLLLLGSAAFKAPPASEERSRLAMHVINTRSWKYWSSAFAPEGAG